MMVFSRDTTTTGSKAGSSNNKNNQNVSKSEQQQQQQPSSKVPRGRKPSKSSKSPLNKNKPRRRGMGIEKLERWLTPWGGGDHNLLPADVASGLPLHPHTHHQFQSTPPPLISLAASPSVYVGSDLLMSRSSSSSSFMAASSKVISTFGSGGGACGKELSSIPKVMQCHQCDASCYSKNKCMNMEEIQGMILGGMNNNQDKLVFPSSLINSCHMLTGLNQGHNNVGLEIKDFNSRVMRQMVYNQDSETMGITRQQASSSCGTLKEYEFLLPGKGLKEYEFFPETSSGRSYTRSSEQPNHYNTTEPAAASYFIPSSDFSQYNAASAANSNALDLSLKLSL